MPALPRYDDVAPGGRVGPFLAAQLLEAFAKLRTHSGFFEGPDHVGLLEAFARYGFPDAEMARRLEMAKRRLRIHAGR